MITTSCLEILRVICILITSLWTSLDMLFTRFNNNNNIVIFLKKKIFNMCIYNVIYLVWWGLAYGPRDQHLLAKDG